MDNSRALAVLDGTKGAMVFARREEIEAVAPQFEPVVTVLELSPEDFTDVGMGNMYPGKAATNRISDAAGVSFLEGVGGTREVGSWSTVKVAKQAGGFYQATGEFKVVGRAQGQRLKPDGTPRLSSVREYEFNVVDRANEDFLKDNGRQGGPKYGTEVAALKHLLELKKFATQRASTGAELAVIRELTGMPTAFKRDQIAKPFVFSQIIENNRFKIEIAREVMKTPDGRKAVVDALFGTARSLYGPQAPQAISAPETIPAEVVSDPVPVQPAAPEQAGQDDDWDDVPTAPSSQPSEATVLYQTLVEYQASGILTGKAKDTVDAAVARNEQDIIILRDLVGRCKSYELRIAGRTA